MYIGLLPSFLTADTHSHLYECLVLSQDQSLRVLSFEARAGRAICPYDPSSNYTVVYVGKILRYTINKVHVWPGGVMVRALDLTTRRSRVQFSRSFGLR